MFRKTLILGALVAMFAVVASPAGAAGTGDLTVSLSIPVAAELVITDGTAAFGTVNPGTNQTQVGTFAWNVSTNGTNGFTVSLTAAALTVPGGATNLPTIQIAKETGPNHADGSTFITVPSAGGSISTTWAATSSSPSASYTDSVKVTVPANGSPGAYSQVLTLSATANP